MDELERKIFRLVKEENGIFAEQITSKEIERQLGISGVVVRKTVSRMREQGIPIGSDSRGYYIIEDRDDYERTLNQLYSRVVGIKNAIAGLEGYGVQRGW